MTIRKGNTDKKLVKLSKVTIIKQKKDQDFSPNPSKGTTEPIYVTHV